MPGAEARPGERRDVARHGPKKLAVRASPARNRGGVIHRAMSATASSAASVGYGRDRVRLGSSGRSRERGCAAEQLLSRRGVERGVLVSVMDLRCAARSGDPVLRTRADLTSQHDRERAGASVADRGDHESSEPRGPVVPSSRTKSPVRTSGDLGDRCRQGSYGSVGDWARPGTRAPAHAPRGARGEATRRCGRVRATRSRSSAGRAPSGGRCARRERQRVGVLTRAHTPDAARARTRHNPSWSQRCRWSATDKSRRGVGVGEATRVAAHQRQVGVGRPT